MDKNIKHLYLLPLLSALLVNLHAAMWPMIFVFVLPYLAESIEFRIGKYRNLGFHKSGLLSIMGTMFLAGFINPYGWKAMSYLYNSLGHPEINQFVGEMRATEINSFFGAFLYGGLLIVILIYLFYRQGNSTVRFVFLTLGPVYLALSAIRSIPLFVIAGLFPLAYYLRDIKLPEFRETGVSVKTKRLRSILIASTLLMILACFAISGMMYGKGNQDTQLLRASLNYVQNERNHGNIALYTSYDDGGLAEYFGIPAYLDSRAEIFVKANNKKSDVMKEFFDLQMGYIYCKDFLDKYHFTHLLVTKKDILYIYLSNDADYKMTYSNSKYFVFEKNDKK